MTKQEKIRYIRIMPQLTVRDLIERRNNYFNENIEFSGHIEKLKTRKTVSVLDLNYKQIMIRENTISINNNKERIRIIKAEIKKRDEARQTEMQLSEYV